MDKKLKILIVEDEFLIALHLQVQLRSVGYDLCELTASGEQAIQVVREENPDVVLMDLNLAGEMDGLQASIEIRSQSSATLIFMTGHMDEETSRKINAMHPAACLTKPVSGQDVHNAIVNR